jgi:hypothetical protein
VRQTWFRVELGYAVFGICVENDQVYAAAPIGRWMIGKRQRDVERWVASKGGSVTEVTV